MTIMITDAERRRRESAVNFARASIGLEGFKPSKQNEDLAQRFISGEFELSEFVQKSITAIEPDPSR